MKKIGLILIIFTMSLTGCSSDDSSQDNEDGEGTVPPKRETYGSFTVNMKIDNQNVSYKYWNYEPMHQIGIGYLKTWIIMSDAEYRPTEGDSKYGDFPGGILSLRINKPEPGLYTIVDPTTYALAHNKFPIEHDKLAQIYISIGKNRKGYLDAKYEYINKGYLVNALEVTKDDNEVLHYSIKKPIPLDFRGGEHGAGNTKAPKVVSLTIDNGHYSK